MNTLLGWLTDTRPRTRGTGIRMALAVVVGWALWVSLIGFGQSLSCIERDGGLIPTALRNKACEGPIWYAPTRGLDTSWPTEVGGYYSLWLTGSIVAVVALSLIAYTVVRPQGRFAKHVTWPVLLASAVVSVGWQGYQLAPSIVLAGVLLFVHFLRLRPISRGASSSRPPATVNLPPS